MSSFLTSTSLILKNDVYKFFKYFIIVFHFILFTYLFIFCFFLRYEKKVLLHDCPKNIMSELTQFALKGKALRAYDTPSVDESRDYGIVRSTVLHAYELRPEAYRQRFRNCRKCSHEIHANLNMELVV